VILRHRRSLNFTSYSSQTESPWLTYKFSSASPCIYITLHYAHNFAVFHSSCSSNEGHLLGFYNT